ncbi:heme-dependent oxidative N-demethylase family protein [Aspergillus stella-maris]|uniref:heme-dependent oxidative N-demethylase family protein n=1 Tax=Aspergillus stella-maris TaxID=1810926 RepID=UPI003CCCA541
MDFLNVTVQPPWLAALAIVTLLGLLLTFLSSSLTKLRTRRTSSSQTPPRSISPEKKAPTSTNPVDILPPQRRHALSALLPNRSYKDVSEEEVRANIFPMTADFRDYTTQDQEKQLYTPTGFSTADLEALGNFPDYATLSGVPLPEKYEGFDIEKALPRPYRPFRWAYHQTMSLTKLETNWWLELENTYKDRISQRKALYTKHGPGVLGALPGSELACKELMEMVIQFLCARYPTHFELKYNRILVNKILGTETDVYSKPPLEILMDHVPEDFGIMLRDDETGNYFLRAGVICSSMGWNVSSKVGLQLHRIHDDIPDYREKMQFSMDRFFTRMPAEKPIQRGSWGLEIGQPLHMPPGDPHEKLRTFQDPNLQIEDVHLRVDWQTLRRLPLSGAVIFNFKALFTPVTEFRDEPGVPALLNKIMKEGKEKLMKYKGTWHVQHVVLPKLEEWAKEQEDMGLVEKDWEVSTLDESPWFRGWEGKWHKQQGF